ncbi:sulfotransferase [Novosphingobium bradum]|uniref:Sulfotransferase n=1 Tax=Novosphingobium bradum TaxID=1737444 RepID=A0ABV7IP64_9SPHN
MTTAADLRQRGDAAFRAGRLGEAIALLRQASARDPADPRTQAVLGQALIRGGLLHEGCAILATGAAALLAASADFAPVLALAALLQQSGDPARALPLAEAVLARRPDDGQALALVATTCAQLGHGARAREAVARACRLSPADPALSVLAASIASDFGNPALARESLAALLAGPLPPREAYRASKELARAADRLGDWPAVFPALEQSARFAAHLPEAAALDPGRIARILAADSAALDPAMLRRWRDDGPADAATTPVFITGFLRSGTTLLQEVFGAHPGTCVADEAPLIALLAAEFERRFPGADSRVARLDRLAPADRAALRAYYRAAAAARLGPEAATRRVVDKFALNVIDLPLILRLFPESAVLFMVRDPRDACLSALLQVMVLTPATLNLVEPAGAAAFHALICGHWRQWRDAAAGAPLAEVRYESLVSDFEPTVRAALAVTGIDWHPAMPAFHKGASGRYIASPSRLQVAQPLGNSAVGRWRHHAADFAPLMPHLAPSLEAWDYPEA